LSRITCGLFLCCMMGKSQRHDKRSMSAGQPVRSA
jgi:hypothetical protein